MSLYLIEGKFSWVAARFYNKPFVFVKSSNPLQIIRKNELLDNFYSLQCLIESMCE